MQILITGNMGYVGPNVARQLRQTYPKAKIIGLDAGYFGHCITTRRILPETRVDIQYFQDVRDVKAEMLKGIDAIVHLAALSNDAMGVAHDQVTLEVNYKASVRLARLAKKAGVKSFVFASSCSVYGCAEEGERTETSAVNPLTAYARSKVMTENGLKLLASPEFKITCLRFATACGMSERLRLDLVLNDFVSSALCSKRIDILSDGTPWRPLIHVRDMARAMDWAIRRSVKDGGPYLVVNAGTNEWNYQVRDLAYAVQKHFRDVAVSINPNASPDKRSYRVDFSLFRRLAPLHQPQMTLPETVRELEEGLKSINFQDLAFRESHLIRLKYSISSTKANFSKKGLDWINAMLRLHLENLIQPEVKTQKNCRFCGTALDEPYLDLGTMPLANSYLNYEDLTRPEPSFALRVYRCKSCSLSQLADYNQADAIFNDQYAYFSSYSTSWLAHAKDYVEKMTQRFHLNPSSQVIEIASNDGYLLQYFVKKGIPVLGIEPCANVARAAEEKGVPTSVRFFGTETAWELTRMGKRADLLLGNNVLAHVPNLNDFVSGLKVALKPNGVLTMEFPHLVKLFERNQFDTIYHEHFSYFTFTAVEKVFAMHGLNLFDVEQLPTHGGSLRIFACHAECDAHPETDRVSALRQEEEDKGFETAERYEQFAAQVAEVKSELLAFLKSAKEKGLHVAAYGAPAKGNTLLNYCGVTPSEIAFTVDLSPHKQGHFLPGSRIPIYSPDTIREAKPDILLILPWNLKDEIAAQMDFIRQWGGKFAVPIPRLEVW
jgi:nucleoside-diphosphate-sugar epimerase/2-polyprenyl-3-methyl-5-hydroxy-6-metoxy-1,4-benzoquinol methylase